MRASEPLERACWGDVNWERRVLCLRDAKTGSRDVPLSPVALQVLRDLGPGKPDERIVKISYDALKKGMARACERAGIKDLHLHDLRRTAATRLALKTGNIFLVKALTGHKTDVMAQRYMQVGADDVVAVMHAPEVTPAALPQAPAHTTGETRQTREASTSAESSKRGPVHQNMHWLLCLFVCLSCVFHARSNPALTSGNT